MFALLRRAARLGLATCALGLAPALAGTPASQTRAEAMKVELAWMSDSRAFALPLEVHGTSHGVELHGKVPDEATRMHVLRLARQSSTATVHDKLTVSAPAPKPQTDPLAAAARGLVARSLGSRAAGIQVSASGDGIVELHGHVATMEDRVAASRCLRGLSGCTQVSNLLEAGKALQPVGAMTVAPAIGPLLLPAPPSPLGSAVPAPQYVRLQVRPEPVPQALPPVSLSERLAAFLQPRAQQASPVLRISARTAEPALVPVAAIPAHQTAWPPAHRIESEAEPALHTQPATLKVTPASLASTGEQPAPPATPKAMPASMATSAESPALAAPPRVEVTPGSRSDAPPPQPATAHKLVMQRCGKLVKSVQATLDQDGKLTLHVHARPKAEQDLVGQLFQIPEFATRRVHIQVHLAQ